MEETKTEDQKHALIQSRPPAPSLIPILNDRNTPWGATVLGSERVGHDPGDSARTRLKFIISSAKNTD